MVKTKSTIIRLLCRFFEPSSGSIRIGEQDITAVYMKSLHKAIAIVPQGSVLFHNIAYGNLSSSLRAAEVVELHSFIQDWPSGHDTAVWERGLKLSGGEKQKLAIARQVTTGLIMILNYVNCRAILKDSSILIFDEATYITESSIMIVSLSYLKGGWLRRVLIISYLLSRILYIQVRNNLYEHFFIVSFSALWTSQHSHGHMMGEHHDK